jgi:hypothetical protein
MFVTWLALFTPPRLPSDWRSTPLGWSGARAAQGAGAAILALSTLAVLSTNVA